MEKFRNIIKQAWYSVVGTDDKSFPSGTLNTNGKNQDFIRLSVYGICSNPVKESHIFVFSSQGRESNLFGILNDFLGRKKNLKEGEVVVHNSKTGTFIYLKENGDINIEAPNTNYLGNLNIDGNLTVTGDISAIGDISTEGDMIADSAGTAISLLQHFHIGNLGYNTDVPAPGSGVSPPSTPPSSNPNGDVIDGSSKNLSTHTHSQGSDGGGDSEVDTSQPL